jgi:hypothetical protein
VRNATAPPRPEASEKPPPLSAVRVAAAAIANARGARNGVPRIKNVLDALPPYMREPLLDDAAEALRAVGFASLLDCLKRGHVGVADTFAGVLRSVATDLRTGSFDGAHRCHALAEYLDLRADEIDAVILKAEGGQPT